MTGTRIQMPKNRDSQSDSAIFLILASKIILNFLVGFLVQTLYVGPRGDSMDEFHQQITGLDFS